MPSTPAKKKPTKQPAPAADVGLSVGEAAPDFALHDQSGELVTLSALRGAPVVLFFYPKDATPMCTQQACAFQGGLGRFSRAGVRVLGISILKPRSKKKFADANAISLPLLADDALGPDKKPVPHAARAFGVWVQKSMYGKPYVAIERTTFLIDPRGKIAAKWDKRTIEADVDAHVDEVLAAAKALG
ncbi:MAG: peroxiredoxin [Phycisphaerales bacterium]|nr:peroxiredoxin [Phycisphaerales bacterium]